MQIDYEQLALDDFSRKEINRLLALPQQGRTDLEQMWFLMDTIWDEYGCDNRNPDWHRIGTFYSHPVWLLNGLFLEQHKQSMQHRHAISDWLAQALIDSVVDYGGGFGTLARLIIEKCPDCEVVVYEPDPADFMLQRLQATGRIELVSSLDRQYDCLVSTDVLEHVADPLASLSEMVGAVKMGGFLIVANNFNPVIKCHMPHTFHLKYTFNFIAGKMGLKNLGRLEGSHATIYKKERETATDLKRLRKYEFLSRACFPVVEAIRKMKNTFKRIAQ